MLKWVALQGGDAAVIRQSDDFRCSSVQSPYFCRIFCVFCLDHIGRLQLTFLKYIFETAFFPWSTGVHFYHVYLQKPVVALSQKLLPTFGVTPRTFIHHTGFPSFSRLGWQGLLGSAGC